MEDVTRAVIYARYSSSAQREESIEGQLRECRDFAEKNDMHIIHEYCDYALSGKTDNRPEFQRLIRDSERGSFTAVIMYTLDRFARNRYDSAIYKAKLKKNGVRVFYAKQPMPDTPEGIILESVLEGYAEYYSENLSRNIKRGLRENALKGLASGQRMPLGYTMAPDKTFQIDPAGATLVREIFQKYADGWNKSKLISWLNDQGYRTSSGRKFTYNSLQTILKNKKYIGTYKYMDITIEGGVPPIVEKSLFDKVQSQLKRVYKARGRYKTPEPFLLTTKLFCGKCGAPMVGDGGTSKTGKVYHYYVCSARKKRKACDKKNEQRIWLENVVIQALIDDVLTDENIKIISKKAVQILEKEQAEDSLLPILQKELKQTESKIDNLLAVIENGKRYKSIESRIEELEELRIDLQDRILRESAEKPKLTEEQVIYWLTRFKSGDINDEEYRRRLVDTLLNAVYVYDDDPDKKIVLTFNLSNNNSKTLTVSDIERLSAPFFFNHPNPRIFASQNIMGIVLQIKGH